MRSASAGLNGRVEVGAKKNMDAKKVDANANEVTLWIPGDRGHEKAHIAHRSMP
jgi:hypothetical protein